MLYIFAASLFLAAFAPVLFLRVKRVSAVLTSSFMMTFSSVYLFSITITHLIPETYASGEDFRLMSGLMLAGFIFQYLIEFFVPAHSHGSAGHDHAHCHHHLVSEKRSSISPSILLMALCFHAFLEGGILARVPEDEHDGHGHFHAGEAAAEYSFSLFLAIILHKTPSSAALLAILLKQGKKASTAVGLLALFSVSAPLGIASGNWLFNSSLLSETMINGIFAFAVGNFMHIATAIFAESEVEGQTRFSRFGAIFLGIGLAILGETLAH